MRRVLKWVGISLGVVVVLGLLGIGAAVVTFKRAVARVFEVPTERVAIPTDEASIAEGKRLMSARGCAECHGEDLGGKFAIEDPMIGRIWAPNISPGKGSVVAGFKDEDWVRAIRHGVKPDGTPVVLMPADEYFHLSDRELGGIIAWAKAAPAVDRPVRDHELTPLFYVLTATRIFPLIAAERMDHTAPRPQAVEPEVSPRFGDYLATIQCRGCHGETLGGGPIPGAPPGLPVPANLTPDDATGLGKWSREEFTRALREGKRPDGRDLDPFMPWKVFSHLDDTEIAALWAYLQTVPAKPFGSR